jgi:hypothetical protein
MDDPIKEVTEALVFGFVDTAIISVFSTVVPHLEGWFGVLLIVIGLASAIREYSNAKVVYGWAVGVIVLIFGVILALASTETLVYLLIVLVLITAFWALVDAIYHSIVNAIQ